MALYGSDLSIDDEGLIVYGENIARLMKLSGKTRSGHLARETRRSLAGAGTREPPDGSGGCSRRSCSA